MPLAKVWAAEVYISEDGGATSAEVRLRTTDGAEISGHGHAYRNPVDRDVPEIGDELAVARALADLSAQLVRITAGDIEDITHERVHLQS